MTFPSEMERYCSTLFKYRPRTEAEIRRRFRRKGFDERLTEDFIAHLYDLDMLNDLRFSEMYIEDGISLKKKGPLLLKEELIKKLGVSPETAEEALSSVPHEEITAILKKDLEKRPVNDIEKWKKKMYRRGFSIGQIREAIENETEHL